MLPLEYYKAKQTFYRKMAFVFRTQNKQNNSGAKSPGPGAYFNKKTHHKQSFESKAPFNNTSFRQIWKTNNLPGPGAYQTQSCMHNQKQLLSDAMAQINIFERPKPSVSFKSKTMRFVQNQTYANPGPGQYDLSLQNKKTLSASKKPAHSSSDLKNFLREKNKDFRKQFQDHRIQQQIIFSANKGIRPDLEENYLHSKNQLGHKTPKKSIFFSSKVERNFIRARPQTSAGPGSYNITKSSFKIQKKQNKKNPTKSICLQNKREKVQRQQVGPGYYDLDDGFKSATKIKSSKKKFQCFGSTVDRFLACSSDTKTNPGPASYELNSKSRIFTKKYRPIVSAFAKEQRRLFESPKNTIVCPGTYQPYYNVNMNSLQLQSHRKDKSKKIPHVKGSFGSTQERFRVLMNNSEILESFNCEPELFSAAKSSNFKKGAQEKTSERKNYKSLLKMRNSHNLSSPKKIFAQKIRKEQQNTRPLCYDNETHTFQYKYGRKTQVQAPFMSCANRFKDDSSVRYIDLEPRSQNLCSQNEAKKKGTILQQNKVKGEQRKGNSMVFKDQRLKYQVQRNKDLGPQFYNPVLPGKKSHNILFS